MLFLFVLSISAGPNPGEMEHNLSANSKRNSLNDIEISAPESNWEFKLALWHFPFWHLKMSFFQYFINLYSVMTITTKSTAQPYAVPSAS